VRIDLQIAYPDGRIKEVTISSDPKDNEHNHYNIQDVVGILFSQTGAYPLEVKDMKPMKSEVNPLADAWDSVAKGDDFKPAMVILKVGGGVELQCGGHRNGHIGGG